jgi:hypothetical protein
MSREQQTGRQSNRWLWATVGALLGAAFGAITGMFRGSRGKDS